MIALASSIALRLTLGPSGLFDTEGIDLSTVDVASEIDILKTAVDQSELFPILHDVAPANSDVVPSPGFDVMGDIFFDAFTDLSGLLSGEEPCEATTDVEVLDTINSLAILPSTSIPSEEKVVQSGKSPRKRTLAVYVEEDDNEFEQEEKKPRTSTSTASFEKYRERRDKNNVASRRSREIKKVKDSELVKKAEELEESNNKLKDQIEELTKHTEFLRTKLIETLSSKRLAQA